MTTTTARVRRRLPDDHHARQAVAVRVVDGPRQAAATPAAPFWLAIGRWRQLGALQAVDSPPQAFDAVHSRSPDLDLAPDRVTFGDERRGPGDGITTRGGADRVLGSRGQR